MRKIGRGSPAGFVAVCLFMTACERHAPVMNAAPSVTTIDDLTTEQALSWMTAPDLTNGELRQELATTEKFRFRNVFSTDKAYCGEFATRGPGGAFGPYERFFRLKEMAAPLYPEVEPNLDLFWSRYCREDAREPGSQRVGPTGVPA